MRRPCRVVRLFLAGLVVLGLAACGGEGGGNGSGDGSGGGKDGSEDIPDDYAIVVLEGDEELGRYTMDDVAELAGQRKLTRGTDLPLADLLDDAGVNPGARIEAKGLKGDEVDLAVREVRELDDECRIRATRRETGKLECGEQVRHLTTITVVR